MVLAKVITNDYHLDQSKKEIVLMRQQQQQKYNLFI